MAFNFFFLLQQVNIIIQATQSSDNTYYQTHHCIISDNKNLSGSVTQSIHRNTYIGAYIGRETINLLVLLVTWCNSANISIHAYNLRLARNRAKRVEKAKEISVDKSIWHHRPCRRRDPLSSRKRNYGRVRNFSSGQYFSSHPRGCIVHTLSGIKSRATA